ncbi:tRNA pseudouridine(38-40) synthase TruA [bacterium]|nr:tRNA pseudouridine(38-40) synthase TruA [bacterium]
MARYKLEIEYIGQNYKGSQKQPDGVVTIQSEIEAALRTLTKQTIKTIFSGRTDAGVNAKGQVLHFDYGETFVASKFVNSLNGLLPNDISVRNIEQVPNDFHSQKSARWRWYQYSIINRTQRSAFDGLSLLVRKKLSLENINCALKQLEGEHDFSAFKSSGTGTPSDICNILYTNAYKQGDEILIDIVGSRFLYNMVRTIVGTILMLEKDGLNPEKIKDILNSKDRKNAGPTISPLGLTFMKAGYEDWTDDTINKIINGDKRI